MFWFFSILKRISKLPFLSKILEEIVYQQLQSFLNKYNLSEVFQSGLREHHSTESALLKVHNDLLLAADNEECVILILLDLSAAFDSVDHQLLINRLEQWVGIQGKALQWFKSYLENRSTDNASSSPGPPGLSSCTSSFFPVHAPAGEHIPH